MPLGRCREPFDHPEWVYELKLDGFRALAYVEDGTTRLVSRNGHSYKSFGPLCTELGRTVRATAAVLDGEVACLGDDGRPAFDALLYRRALPHFCAFDLLWLEGKDLRERTLVDRKRLLRRIIPRGLGWVRYVPHVRGRGSELFRLACELDLEGVVAKWAPSPYRLVGEGSPWLKIKNREYTPAHDRHELFDGFRRRAG